jgi:hypothetical protein
MFESTPAQASYGLLSTYQEMLQLLLEIGSPLTHFYEAAPYWEDRKARKLSVHDCELRAKVRAGCLNILAMT